MNQHVAEVASSPPPLPATSRRPVPAGKEGLTAVPRWDIPEPLAVAEVRTHDGADIILRRHGNPAGPRLVVSHGNGLSADAYYPFWSLFTNRFDIVLYDFRNHGWNPVGDQRAHAVDTFVRDNACIAQAIDQRFGNKPRIGVFHSTSALTALLPGAETHGFSALVLFDPPFFSSSRRAPREARAVETLGRRLARTARRRRTRFDTWEDLAETLSGAPAFSLLRPGATELLARTTLRRASGTAYELCCPREYEAQIFAQMFGWTTRVDLEQVRCPVKVIGGDPAVPFSFLPSVDLDEIIMLDYDFLPDTTHFLQLEEPEKCVASMLRFLECHGLASC